MNTQLTRWFALGLMIVASLSCFSEDRKDEDKTLVIYCGRGQSLVGPLIEQFQQQTGIDVQVKYGDTSQLAATLKEEGDKSPADLFWAQDAASLGQISKEGRFGVLPDSIVVKVAPEFRAKSGAWVATSGRARVLAYAPARVKAADLPKSVFDLTDPKWKGRVGWAPSNASFQAFVTAMRLQHGEAKARAWLEGMKKNETKVFPKNTPIIAALASGEIDLGLPNHYYLLREKAKDPAFPVEQTFFQPGDVGNLLLVSGIGQLKTARHSDNARKFVEFLLTPESAQRFFAGDDKEYSVIPGAVPRPELPSQEKLHELAPKVDMDQLNDLAGTQKLLREVGIL